MKQKKSPRTWVSWIFGIVAVVAVLGVYLIIMFIEPSVIKLILVITLMCVSIGIVVGEIIHIHRKLNYIEQEEQDG